MGHATQLDVAVQVKFSTQLPPTKLYPPIQLVHVVGLFTQVAQGYLHELIHVLSVVSCKPDLQAEHTPLVQVVHPVGHAVQVPFVSYNPSAHFVQEVILAEGQTEQPGVGHLTQAAAEES